MSMRERFLNEKEDQWFPDVRSPLYVVGYKKLRKVNKDGEFNYYVATLLIPCITLKYGNNSVRLCGLKCRAKYAWVYRIERINDKSLEKSAKSMRKYYNPKTKREEHLLYRVGRYVHCDKWEEDMGDDCGGGIHFYLNRFQAENH